MDTNTYSRFAKPWRRWLRVSLRTVFLLVAVLCIWLGLKVNAARKQVEAVATIRAAGTVFFDNQIEAGRKSHVGKLSFNPKAVSSTPAWLRALFDDDFFRTAVAAGLSSNNEDPTSEIPMQQVCELPGLRNLELNCNTSDAILRQITCLRNLEYVYFYSNHVSDAGIDQLKKLKRLKTVDILLEAKFNGVLEQKSFPDLHLDELQKSLPGVAINCTMRF